VPDPPAGYDLMNIDRSISLQTVAELSGSDVATISQASPQIAEQLERSIDSIGINISEGYGRLHGRERARFYEFALGSAREAREWYARVATVLIVAPRSC